ncbi:MAG: hypothetical protein ACK5FT_04985 [Sphingomonadales bacterium]
MWGISEAKVIQMDHQTERSGMHVENPLELQMLFSDSLLLDHADKLSLVATDDTPSKEAITLNPPASLPIAFFIEIDKTRAAGFDEIETLLGRMLLVTSLDGKTPSMESAEILNLVAYDEVGFNEKVQQYRKIVVFTDTWPFQGDMASKYYVHAAGNTKLLITPSVPSVMADVATKKEFALHLKQYFALI